MDIGSLISQAQSYVSVLSNPQQSSIAAAGLAGAFSAEVNNLRQGAQADLSKFGVTIPAPLQGVFAKISAPFQQVLNGSPSNPIPNNPSGTIFGMSYLMAGLIAIVGILGTVFLIGRRSS